MCPIQNNMMLTCVNQSLQHRYNHHTCMLGSDAILLQTQDDVSFDTAGMNVITALLFFLSGLFGGYSLLPKRFFYVTNVMTWTDAQSYCRQKYTDLVFVYSKEDIDKIKASLPLFVSVNAWIGGFDMNFESDSQNITESENTQTQNCLTIDTHSWKLAKKSCTLTYSFFCSQSEGKRVVLRMKVNTDGQLDLKDPGIRSKMLDKINEKFNKIGFGDAIKIQWITTRRATLGKTRANNTCNLDTN
ncbi:uncharacterized protein LOC125251565 [Megalobrama amblycephala]|uniref:uncharacterized protein LOC125251565 n=1 Tax=Megalobrama amblycephala TaxID=75352 RepID=UPI002013E256|nr:uncharacterized protein LOC125251565 [Megalobrama amblycephala]